MTNQPDYNQFFHEVMSQISAHIGRNLNPAQAAWAAEAFRVSILPETYHSAAPETQADLILQARSVAEEILSEWSGLDGSRKWRWILSKAYACQLLPLSRESFRLAQAFHAGDRSEQIRSRARVVERRLSAILQGMDQDAPLHRRALADMVSEIVLDCRYAQGMGEGVSLRMGHILQRQS